MGRENPLPPTALCVAENIHWYHQMDRIPWLPQLYEQPSKVKSPTRKRTAQKCSPKFLQCRVEMHSLLTHFLPNVELQGWAPTHPSGTTTPYSLEAIFFPPCYLKKKKKKGVKAFIILKTCQLRRRLCVSDACFLADFKSFAQLLGWRGQEKPAATGCELEL